MYFFGERIPNKCCSFELSIKQRILKKMYLSFYKIKQCIAIIRNVSKAPNQQINIISEGLCDTEAWSNDAENSALAQVTF